MFLRVDEDKLYDWTVEELEEELEETDTLPKGFWTEKEWYEIHQERRAIREEIKKVLSKDPL